MPGCHPRKTWCGAGTDLATAVEELAEVLKSPNMMPPLLRVGEPQHAAVLPPASHVETFLASLDFLDLPPFVLRQHAPLHCVLVSPCELCETADDRRRRISGV